MKTILSLLAKLLDIVDKKGDLSIYFYDPDTGYNYEARFNSVSFEEDRKGKRAVIDLRYVETK